MANEITHVKLRLTCALQEIKTLRNSFFKMRAENARLKSLLRANNVFDEAEQSESSSRDGHSSPDEQELTPIIMKPIGHIESSFANKRAVPRQPTIMNNMRGIVVINKTVFNNPEHALDGLQDYSHMWILFHFHQNEGVGGAKVAPPRLRGERRGVFSTRAPHRPCPIGLSLVQITAINGNRIEFVGVDMVNGTPVLDVKPYIPQYDMPGPTDNRVDVSSPTVPVPLDLFSSSTPINQLDMTSPNTPVTQDQTSPNTPVTLDQTSPNTPVTQDQTSPNTPVTQDFVSLDTPVTIDLTSPNTPDTIDLTSPNTPVTQVLTSPHTPVTQDRMSSNTSVADLTNPITPDTKGLTSANTSVTSANTSVTSANTSATSPNTSVTQDLSFFSEMTIAEGLTSPYIRSHNLCNSTASSPGVSDRSVFPGTSYRMASGHYSFHGFSNQDEPPAVSEEYASPEPTLPSFTNGRTADFTNLTLDENEISLMVRDSVRGSPDGQEMLGCGPAPADIEVRVAPWVTQTPQYTVRFTHHALALLEGFLEDRASAFRANIERLLAEDPRSQYIRTRYPDSPYNCVLEDLSICCIFDEESAVCTVTTVRNSMDM